MCNVGQDQKYWTDLYILITIISRLVKVVQEPDEFQQTYNVKIEILSCIMTKW